ncbi:MAG: ribose-phosphate pyrophosphokinase [Bacteroidales bacterium]|nr:ribose-phosphate pyrophosphokinase [Bacteroidales bacterium]MBO7142709.1 ribose-phosphate pyrophosphokinase [Bacteroidales bacterium]MBP5503237.1 ribose-phosphate pyrophosphokinase [Bacteroidales bacterium]MBR4216006.1 ribose-phosphate pyrophosphokinase [Bacteroidales bacterium]
MASSSNIKIFSGTTSLYLSEQIAKAYGTTLGNVTMNHYSDGEYQPSLNETVRGSYVFIVQSTFTPADNLFELLLMIDAARRASAYKIAAVIPYFGFARQDRKDKPRVAIGAKLIANLLTKAGVDRIITMDLHADQIQGFFDVPVDHLYSSTIFVPFINSLKLENLVVASPDIGGSKRANTYSKFLQVPMVICHKYREKANEVSEMTVIGDVKGKNVIIIDDIIDTAGTLSKAADLMMGQGALSVRAFITHPVLSGPAYDRITESKLTELYVTDTIPLKKPHPKIKVLTVANLFADVIKKVFTCQSISDTSYYK